MRSTDKAAGVQRRVYLLRLWRETADSPWRASLHPAGAEMPLAFPDLETLAYYLLSLPDQAGVVTTVSSDPRETGAGHAVGAMEEAHERR